MWLGWYNGRRVCLRLLEDNLNFHVYPMARVWEAQAVACSKHPFYWSNDLDAGAALPNQIDNWPEGTVFCEKIKLVKKV